MCFFGGGGSRQPKVAKYDSKNDPVVIEGEQEGVENPIDTKKATDELKIQKEAEGRMANPDITTAQALGRSSGSALSRSVRSARLRSGVSRGPNAPSRAQKAAAARRASKSKR